MSGGSTMTKDFMKMQSFNSDAQSCVENNNGDPSISCLEKGAMKEHKKTGMKLTKDMNQTICLFQKYLLAKTQHNIGKTNMEESESIKRCTSRPLVPAKFGCNQPRRISLLEQALLPRINRHDATQADASSDDKSSTAQLTIFYSGTINVYDDIPADKVQAIMLLASESTSTNLATKKVPKTNVTTPTHQSNFPSVCKLQAELPIARKYSIQRFLEKRRDRITNKSPYAPSRTKNDHNEQDGGPIENHNFSPSPFPSRLGYFFPISSNN